jgi:hypothetical protein
MTRAYALEQFGINEDVKNVRVLITKNSIWFIFRTSIRGLDCSAWSEMLNAGIVHTLASVIETRGPGALLELARHSDLLIMRTRQAKLKFQPGDTRAAVLETTAIASLVDRR